jgi:SAM-dependent methyltransferase
MAFKDLFSQHSRAYASHRPSYPDEMFAYLASVAPGRSLAWDCGTGNGQAAVGLARYFERVIATDASAEQIRNAFPNDRVTYKVANAEEPGLEPGSVDLVTVAQALHWFDLDAFYAAAKRVLRRDGVLAAWAYALCRTTPDVDRIIDDFYFEGVGPYWPKERALVDDGYRSIPFPFDELQPPEFSIVREWDMADMLAYLRTWSPVRLFIAANGYDPVEGIEEPLADAWGDLEEKKTVVWPIFMRIGRTQDLFILGKG